MPLSSDKVVNKKLTQFFKRTHSVWRYLVEPYLCWPLKGGRESPTYNLVWNPLKVHRSLEGCDVITRVVCSIIRVQERHLGFRRQGVTVDESHERRISSMN